MTRMLWLLAFLPLLPVPATAQSVRGTVIDDDTREPIAGAVVELHAVGGGRVASVQSGADGRFLATVRRSGVYTIHLFHIGYRAIVSDSMSLRTDEAVVMELRMARTTIPLEPLVVTARSYGQLEGFRERMRSGGFGHYITRADIERRPGASPTTLLREIPGVQIVQVGQLPRQQTGEIGEGGVLGDQRISTVSLRSGSGSCDPTIFIDGMVISQFSRHSGIDELLLAEHMEGVEVYHGNTAPAPFHARDGCGVVAFWTRPGGTSRFSWRKLGGGLVAFALGVALSTRL